MLEKCRFDVGTNSFLERKVKYWNRLPRQAVDAPSLEVFKAGLGGDLGNLV